MRPQEICPQGNERPTLRRLAREQPPGANAPTSSRAMGRAKEYRAIAQLVFQGNACNQAGIYLCQRRCSGKANWQGARERLARNHRIQEAPLPPSATLVMKPVHIFVNNDVPAMPIDVVLKKDGHRANSQ